MLDLNDEVIKTNIDKYLVPRLYAAAVVVGETVYELLFKLFRELLIKLQRENAFT